MYHNTSLFWHVLACRSAFSLTSCAGCKHMPPYNCCACDFVRLPRNATLKATMTMTIYPPCYLLFATTLQHPKIVLRAWLESVSCGHVACESRGALMLWISCHPVRSVMCAADSQDVASCRLCVCALLCAEIFTGCSKSSSGQ